MAKMFMKNNLYQLNSSFITVLLKFAVYVGIFVLTDVKLFKQNKALICLTFVSSTV